MILQKKTLPQIREHRGVKEKEMGPEEGGGERAWKRFPLPLPPVSRRA